MAQEHHITIAKSARYFTLGKLNEHTKEVWLVLHGYAQLASDFSKPFSVLDNGSRFIVAPEGLNKFYAKGFGGKPAATWMTSEDREVEIADYLNYLNLLCASLQIPSHIKFIVLGFSQGVATASRFVHQSNLNVGAFIIYSGDLAAELVNPVSAKIKALPITYVTGTKDPLITPEKHQQVFDLMHQLNARVVTFEGGHEVKEEALLSLVD
ncbi:MAG: phospholipase [Bacteroidetes bacterium]|nr:MAG: phospholipase [Bacteroidota bacterium]